MKSIERLLRLCADFHNFCSEPCEISSSGTDLEELSVEELDCIAAASLPLLEREGDKTQYGLINE